MDTKDAKGFKSVVSDKGGKWIAIENMPPHKTERATRNVKYLRTTQESGRQP